jgi:hypothetical protein
MFYPYLLPPLSHLPPPGRVEAARSSAHKLYAAPAQSRVP